MTDLRYPECVCFLFYSDKINEAVDLFGHHIAMEVSEFVEGENLCPTSAPFVVGALFSSIALACAEKDDREIVLQLLEDAIGHARDRINLAHRTD